VDVLFDQMAGDFKFEAVRARAVKVPLENIHVLVACLEDIIASKRAANRPKDLAQLPILVSTQRVLEKIEKLKR